MRYGPVNSRTNSPGKGFLGLRLLRLPIQFLAVHCVTRGRVTRDLAGQVEAPHHVAGEEMRGEGELVDPGQDDVLGGLRDEHSEHCQNTRDPQLHRGHRHLWRYQRRGNLSQLGQHKNKTAAEDEEQSMQGKSSHHGDRDGEHALQKHVYGSEGGGRDSLKQGVQHSQSLWRVQVHLRRQSMTNVFCIRNANDQLIYES